MSDGPNWWDILSLLGIWAAAFATFYAARTALKIASSQMRVDLKVEASSGFFINVGEKSDAIIFTITNTGSRDVTLREISWHHYFLGKSRAVQIPCHPMDDAKLPCKIEFSQRISFYIDRYVNGDWFDDFASQMYGERYWFGRMIVRKTLVAQVTTGTGEVFKGRVANSILGELNRAYKRISKPKGDSK